MATFRNRIEEVIKITGEDKASPMLAALRGELGKFEESAQSTAAKWVDFGAKASVVAFAVKEVAEAVGAFVVEGAAFADQTAIMNREVKGFDEIIRRAHDAAAGMISKRTLTSAAATFDQFGISLDEFDRIAEQVAKTAAKTGQSADELFGKLALGLGRMSAQRLDDLGVLVADQAPLMAAYAESIGKTADALSEADKRAALLAESLRQMEANTASVDLNESRAAAIQSVANAWEDAKDQVSGYVATVLVDLARGWGEVADEINRVRKARERAMGVDKGASAPEVRAMLDREAESLKVDMEATDFLIERMRARSEGAVRVPKMGPEHGGFEDVLADPDAPIEFEPMKITARKRRPAKHSKRTEPSRDPEEVFRELNLLALEQAQVVADVEAEMDQAIFDRMSVEVEATVAHYDELERLAEEHADRLRVLEEERLEDVLDFGDQVAEHLAGLAEGYGETGEMLAAGLRAVIPALHKVTEEQARYNKLVEAGKGHTKEAEVAQGRIGSAYVEAAGMIGSAVASQIRSEKARAGVMAAVYAAQAIAYAVLEEYEKAALSAAAAAAFAVAAGTGGGGGGAKGAAARPAARRAPPEGGGGGQQTTIYNFPAGFYVGSTQELGAQIAAVGATIGNTGHEQASGRGA